MGLNRKQNTLLIEFFKTMKKLTILFLVLGMFACEQKPSKMQQEYKQDLKEVLDVHDNVMGKMNIMGNLISEIKKPVEDSTENTQEKKGALNDLEKAHEGMMEWMHNFAKEFPDAQKDTTFTKEEYERRIEILQEEKKSIEKVKNDMESSIQKGKDVLQK